jgi:hypothetical protein
VRIPPKTLVCCAAAWAAVAAGCGGSDDDAQPPQPAASTQTQTTATAPAPPPSKRKLTPAVAPAKKRLEKAGYDVIVSGVQGVDPPPQGALELPLDKGGQVTVYAYASAADAKEKAAEFEPLARKYPAFYAVAVEGSTTYVGSADEPERLDRKGFDRAVARAENK